MMTRTTERIRRTCEIFTPPSLVNEMLDKLPPEAWEPAKTYCDPACGDGNFLVEVLKRKLALGQNDALQFIYGVDIMLDNIFECRARLLEIAGDTFENRQAVYRNIFWADQRIYPRGSLDFNFDFDNPECLPPKTNCRRQKI